jgi:cob(I)alamin adenosyltransferase
VRRRSNLAAVKVYTRKGDDGSTGLFYGGRVAKDDTGPEAYGTTDEAVAALGVARALAADAEPELAEMLLDLQRQMFVVGAELATAPENRHKLEPGSTAVTAEMVTPLEEAIDRIEVERGMPTEFVVPGQNPLAAALDQARTIVRRAERRAVTHARAHSIEGSHVVPYLNRLADYLWMAARLVEPDWESSRGDARQ